MIAFENFCLQPSTHYVQQASMSGDRTLLDALLAGRLIRAVQDPSAYSAVCLRLWWIRESRKSSEQIQFDAVCPGQCWRAKMAHLDHLWFALSIVIAISPRNGIRFWGRAYII
ncbi:MAG: hypothetical protein WBW67_08200 [Pseudolabrys sp.]